MAGSICLELLLNKINMEIDFQTFQYQYGDLKVSILILASSCEPA